MVVKSKAKPKQKSKTNVKAKVTLKSKAAVKAKSAAKTTYKPKVKAKKLKKQAVKPGVKTSPVSEPKVKPQVNVAAAMMNAAAKTHVVAKPVPSIVKRTLIPLVDRHKPIKRSTRVNQFAFMKAPGLEHAFEVGDSVEVFCDHEKSRERIRGWIKGIVVQVDNKMVAVQFRSNVYLTDGWMVPDRILWYPLTSEHIRPVAGKKPAMKKDFIPDY
ncbi:MAG: hypothetical protein JNM02_06630 [Anaerolineales bacterium]|nr:hypothetical protein [Anaerolineales bacterium]